ncbi:CPBP family intramembrane glutamic endopeptidase [Microbacterium sp. VKM Ac-2923]|uniref:CPBP family intramembrane glutamic endopeptidase n=1 Tax=Microbacterium sp. VKM Ac-2923 TaxID=2929476 RepID=UPI001FB428AE|nr:CPBP family intramembrane glutamic endopeptidase [Microbacterium sp. VKM Ac-2923]MCJ1706815.1 CPBP family intramembrane metalloprotease [Microbacterium sp. VKM Ac-2923]
MRRWNGKVLAVALVAGGLSVMAAGVLSRFQVAWAASASIASLWGFLLVAVIYAFVRGRPAGLFRFRGTDVLWGVAVGLALRAVQGWVSAADTKPFPVLPGEGGSEAYRGWAVQVVPTTLVGPIVEELFFRAVVLVTVYQIFRRSLGYVAASVTAILSSAGGFVLLHTFFSPLALTDALQLFLVGAAAAVLVIMTGRLWAAMLAHLVYNVSFLVLVVVGTALG